MCLDVSAKNQEWTLSRLRRLQYMIDNGSAKTLILESFICDDYHLKIGLKLISWRKKELNGASN